ncbi:hypothetical protein GCM10023189_37870 [Nibrella saemangeumensis]|uniref:Uncharacterized protein n=1 Tax=Nibrella saemangeumensis TaxID=1084526 RepID=A0ABP8N5W0_9BACT
MYKHIDTDTGDITFTIKYLQGRPKQYRFNGQTGRFNINGTTDVGTTLTIQPLAWRIFDENLFARGRNETWAELFFVDDKGALSAIMFNNSSVNELFNLIEPLFYDDLQLSDVVLTITSEKKKNEKVQPAGTWFLARFTYKPADPATVAELREFVTSIPVYRQDTLTSTAVYHVVADSFAVGLALPAPAVAGELPAAE